MSGQRKPVKLSELLKAVSLAAGLVFLSLLTACASPEAHQQVSLELEPENEVEIIPADALRVAVAAVLAPQGTVVSYTPLLNYLGEHLGRPVALVQRQTYAEVNDLIKVGEIELAFICTGAYVQGKEELDAELLAAPQVNGQTVYYSYIIVPADSTAQSLTDLRNQTFAFTDPLSNSGRMAAAHMLWQQDETPESFFAETIFTYSHDNSIQAVADALVDGAAVDSLVYEYFVEREPDVAAKTRIVGQSVPYGIPPVVVPAGLDQNLKSQLQEAFVSMHQTEQGKIILDSLHIDRFVAVDDSAYDSVRQMLSDLEKEP